MSDLCSYTRPHTAHTWGGRPMRLCPGVGRFDLHEDRSPEPTTCIDCGRPTTPGKGSARCPGCWEDRCGSGDPKLATRMRWEPEPVPRSCNRHSDCDKAVENWKRNHNGQMPSPGFHCHDDECEDCFGC
jgi:hypothetical protein